MDQEFNYRGRSRKYLVERKRFFVLDEALQADVIENRPRLEEIAGDFLDTHHLPYVISREDCINAIIDKYSRPAYQLINNNISLESDDLKTRVWLKRIKEFIDPPFKKIFPSIGRINTPNHSRKTWVGTGWLVKDDIIVTNRHVAQEFINFKRNRFSENLGIEYKVFIDFYEEFGNTKRNVYQLIELLHYEQEPDADIAFFKVVKTKDSIEQPLPLILDDEVVEEGQFLLTIGYPSRPDDEVYNILCDKIFNTVYGKKTASPGKVIRSTDEIVFHDCSTLCGHSGGLILDMVTGKPVGLHFGGTRFTYNYGVPISLVKKVYDRYV